MREIWGERKVMAIDWHSRLHNLSLKWKTILLAVIVFGASLTAGFAYFAYQSYWLNVTTALAGLMNFTDAKQQGVIRFIDQNKKLARQLADSAAQLSAIQLRNQFQGVVTTDVFRLDEHPFRDEINAGARHIPTWKVYHSIDYVLHGVIVVSSDPQREGKTWDKSIDPEPGYSDPYYEGAVPVMTFRAPSREGAVYVNVDARMLTNIVSGEIGNLAGIGAYYLAGVGKTFDYYIVNKENLLITESRTRPGQFLNGKGSTLPWLTTLQRAGVVCGKRGVYTTDAKCTTGCREAMGFYVGPSGKTMLGASMPFYDSSWTLVVEQEANELLQPMWIMFAEVLGILLFIGAIAIFIYLRWQNALVIRPLSNLQNAIESFEASNDFGKQIAVDSEDEIGRLGNAYNRMARHLHTLYSTLENRVEERTHELNVSKEQLAEKELAKTRFLAAAGHDLRQPIAAATLLVGALKFSSPNQRQNELIERLDQSMSVFSLMLDRLLDISKFDAGLVKPKVASFDLEELFIWLSQNFAQTALDKQLRFRISYPASKTLIVRTDMELVQSVLMNLVSNAIKFTERGSILVTARLRGDKVLVQVWDTGIGIAKADIPHVFDEFYQVANPQRSREKGLGLGLSICQRAMSLLGSKVTCHSRPGRGSVFEFCLPLNGEQHEIVPLKAGNTPTEVADEMLFRGKSVVVVEDDAQVAQATVDFLIGMGGEVRCFHSAEDALEFANIGHADYYIVDYMLGGALNGIQFLNRLRRKLGKPVNAVLVTGDTSPTFVRGVADCDWPVLHKPVNTSELISCLSSWALK